MKNQPNEMANIKEHKVRITKTQLRKIIKEAIQQEADEGGEGVHDIFNMPEPETVEPSGNPKEDAIRSVLANQQAAEIDGETLDLFSAPAIVQVLDALNDDNREKFLSVPVSRMASIAFKMMK